MAPAESSSPEVTGASSARPAGAPTSHTSSEEGGYSATPAATQPPTTSANARSRSDTKAPEAPAAP
ncbi:hypothetical protein [Georgenia soli]|uniref:hypothetical protein n=1 Tax=Georgenia soli TaxID=638953 RepID=UPI001179E8B2|nr:hypothetical protein [Georgenia soli]